MIAEVKNNRMPSRKEVLSLVAGMALFISVTALFVGLRPEHFFIAALFAILFFAGPSMRKLAVALLPFAIFGISYDWMRIWPNYEVNPVDVAGLYNLEKSLFGVMDGGVRVTPCEYFSAHYCTVADVAAGFFYLCWVPVPILFGLWLYVRGKRTLYLHFALVFLLVNLIGFMGYYIYPAAPPWYAIEYGFEPLLHTPGNVAGLGRFDDFFGVNIFHSIYGRNANVFAAVPSLHAAYMPVALIYAWKAHCRWHVLLLFAIITAGIWGTAVYSCHHYIIDVLLGILCATAGWLFFEYGCRRIPVFARFLAQYAAYIG